MSDLPWLRTGPHGTVTINRSADGAGYVVDFISVSGRTSWETFKEFHTAKALFYALAAGPRYRDGAMPAPMVLSYKRGKNPIR